MSRRTLRADKNLYGGFTNPLGGFTLVEMLIAMAITLVMMAALVTVFANISGSVTRRRATIEMSSALRNVRETLARDLAGATCPAVPWQRPESNVGYLEIIEGPQNDYYPSPWLYSTAATDTTVNGVSIPVADTDANGSITESIGNRPGIDLAISSLPGSNLRDASTPDDEEGRGAVIGTNAALPAEGFATDGRGLGDADDILMLTVRNENEPFVGRIPSRNDGSTPANSQFGTWYFDQDVVESQLAEVVWFALENPTSPDGAQTFAFGEPGYRTIYRRALLIIPDLDYRIDVVAGGVETANPNTVAGVLAKPGVVRVFPPSVDRTDVSIALAGLIAFQERFDLSVHVVWDPLLPSTGSANGFGRWVLRANSLADLTKRENRYEHHGYVYDPQLLIAPAGNGNSPARDRYFPFAVASAGFVSGGATVDFRQDRELLAPNTPASFTPVLSNGSVVSYQPGAGQSSADLTSTDRVYAARPLVRFLSTTDTPATARAVLDEDGHIVHLTRGLAPLSGARRGDDVMMTDALGFDIRVFDPGAPTYAYYPGADKTVRADQMIRPGDPAWARAFAEDVPSWLGNNYNESDVPGDLVAANEPLVWQRSGAYVDLGYGSSFIVPSTGQIPIGSRFVPLAGDRDGRVASGNFASLRFFDDGRVRLSANESVTSLYAIYDTWSSHYESNGINEDLDVLRTTYTLEDPERVVEISMVDEGSNGIDDPNPADRGDLRIAEVSKPANQGADDRSFYGPDDPAERETRPPYDTALRGVQVALRVYERDSRQIREVKVRESFVPE